MSSPLDSFSPFVRAWFTETFGRPTPPQEQGWPPIQRGEHTLILAPTGSGKTLAAFLWGIDRLYRELEQLPMPPSGTAKSQKSNPPEGIRLLYVSPLKALNNDVERNLRVPVEGIRAVAARAEQHLPALRVAVRTGDTPSSVRTQMRKHPPHILITTPESLYLMLTSPRARELFRTVESVIVDEIHTVCGNKRGAHLGLSLERLAHLAYQPIQRIGLSATIKPLDEVARFLGGQRPSPRPVTVVDARYHKPLELQVVTVVDDFRELPGDTIWPSVIPHVLNDIRQHDTTLIFANNRRLAERTADRLNAQLQAEQSEEIPPGSPLALAPKGIPRGQGIFAIGAQGPIRAHHGSMSHEARRKMEEDLKAGKLPALVGTSSLELGIDIGSVDLVVQLQSPKSVAQGLQRVGRSGHLVGQTSRGRIYATFREDLAEAAAIARGMLEGDVEPTRTPQNPLDVLAQQIVAMVAMEDWDVEALYQLVRRAYPYSELSWNAFTSVLDMLTGKYYTEASELRAVSSLRAKIAWDRVNNRLTALPGSRLLAISNVGTIPDTGAYKVYLSDGKTRVGELDEEFVYETRVGDVFLLGSSVWRVHDIQDDRVIVSDAAGATPRMPFWHGDYPWRPYELGERIGRFRREVAERIEAAAEGNGGESADPLAPVEGWLREQYALDVRSARNLVAYVKQQLDANGALSSDRTLIAESFQNAVGDWHLVIHSPFGGRVNGAWAIALSSALAEKTGVVPEFQAGDDGIILRFPSVHSGPGLAVNETLAELVRGMSAAEARERILRELPNSAAFGAQFRMNAARALLLSRPKAGKRTPFWLQRLKARDLLAYVRQFDDFPILIETYRDCLRDVFDLPHLESMLDRIAAGEIRVVSIESIIPSPVAAGLLFNFVAEYLYEWDAPKAERQLQALAVRFPAKLENALEDVLQGVELSDVVQPGAIDEVVARAQHLEPGYQARTAQELAVFMDELGDLSTAEIAARSAGDARAWIAELAAQGRIVEIPVPTSHGPEPRWVPVHYREQYASLGASSSFAGRTAVLRRFLRAAGPVTREQILQRYGFDPRWLDETLAQWVASRELVRGHLTSRVRDEYCDHRLLEQIHRRTLTVLRKQVQPVPLAAYSALIARWQHAHPAARWGATSPLSESVRAALEQLRGLALPGLVWERDVLPARVAGYSPAALDALGASGELVWVGAGRDPRRGRVRLLFRGEGSLFLPPADESDLSDPARAVYDFLKSEGASFASDLQASLSHSVRDAAELSRALVELVLCGLITNDEVNTLREIMERGAPSASYAETPARPASALEAELAARLGPRRPSRTRYQDAKRRVAQRLRAETPASPWRGRWSPVYRAGVMGPPLTADERAERLARVLLARYGVVTREVLELEELSWDLGLVYAQLQRMEWRGEVRRGYFVAGLSGVQYALPDAVEQLRAVNDSDDTPFVVLNATDPANLYGGALEGAPRTANGDPLRFARVPSNTIVLQRGQPVLLVQENGQELVMMEGVTNAAIEGALRAWLTRPNAARHLVVQRWDGAPVGGSAGEPLLKTLGFYRIPGGMEWWASPS